MQVKLWLLITLVDVIVLRTSFLTIDKIKTFLQYFQPILTEIKFDIKMIVLLYNKTSQLGNI